MDTRSWAATSGIALAVVAADLVFVWQFKDFLTLAIAGTGIITFFGILIISNFYKNSLSTTEEKENVGAVRQALAGSLFAVYFVILGISLGNTTISTNNGTLLKAITDNFWGIILSVVAFYFGSEGAKGVANALKTKNGGNHSGNQGNISILSIKPTSNAPIVTKTNGEMPLTVGFYFNPNDPNLTVEWKQYDNRAGVVDGVIANFIYFNEGNFQAQLIVRDGSGKIVNQRNFPITVVKPQDNRIKFSQQYAIGYAGKLDPGVSVALGISPLKITWNFGKGTDDYITKNIQETNPMYTYKNPGTYDGYVTMDTGDGRTMIQRNFQVIVL